MKSMVCGLGFGDEGKGLVTDLLCSRFPQKTQVVRFSGGHQCGHRVVRTMGGKEVSHVFANFGSGTLAGCATYWSQNCTVEPVGFMKEFNILKQLGVTANITFHMDCPITTPYDIKASQSSPEVLHGTTGTGFFRTLERNKVLKLTIGDIVFPQVVKIKMDAIRDYYKNVPTRDLMDFYEAIIRMHGMIGYNVGIDEGKGFWNLDLDNTDDIVFEGSQGLLLDQNIGFFPNVTPSNLYIDNILKMGARLDQIYLVTRAYQTRHGNGPMTGKPEDLELNPGVVEETNKNTGYQGDFRKTPLDLELLKYVMSKTFAHNNTIKHTLVITCTDQIKPPFKIYSGGKLQSFDTAENFANYISTELLLWGTLISKGPKASDVVEVRKK